MKPLNSGHLRVLKSLFVMKRCLIVSKIVSFGTKHFVRYSRHVHYLGCPQLGGFTVLCFYCQLNKSSCSEQVNVGWALREG